MAVILVTHNFGVVADICDRVSVMRNGRVVETGPVRVDLLRRPARVHPVAAGRHPRGGARPRTAGHGRRHGGAAATAVRQPAADWSVVMTDLLLDAQDVVVEYPGQGLPEAAVQGAQGRVASTSGPARPSAWSASPDPARPPSAGPCSAWPRSPAGRSSTRDATSPTCPAGSAAGWPARSRWCSRTRTPR